MILDILKDPPISSSTPYDLKPVDAPRLKGLGLRLFTALIESVLLRLANVADRCLERRKPAMYYEML